MARLVSTAIFLTSLMIGAKPVAAAPIVVPAGFENTAGGFMGPSPFRRSGTGGSRNQIVYPGGAFGGPVLIDSIAFRPVNFAFPANPPPTLTIGNVSIALSTTSAAENSLSPTFANNVGADAQTVFSGPLTLTPGPITGNGLRDFDYLIEFQSPFLFDPADGNLLLDAVIPAGTQVQGSGFFGSFVGLDTRNALNDGLGSVVNINANGPTGSVSSAAPIARFQVTPVPEPGSVLIFVSILMLCAVIYLRTRRRARIAST